MTDLVKHAHPDGSLCVWSSDRGAWYTHDLGDRCLDHNNSGPLPLEPLGETRITSDTGGEKGQKLARIGSLDPLALLEVGKVAGFGEQKYDRLNYMRGYDWSLSFDAGMRHRLAHWSGEERDPESGLYHLAHAAWHDLTQLAFLIHELGTDDRFKGFAISDSDDVQ